MAATTSTDSDDRIWKDLVQWILENGGHVHPALELRTISTKHHRGVFCSRAIAEGDLLIRLPTRLAIDGQDMPEQYTSNDLEERKASPWLRCLAAYWKAQEYSEKSPYLASIPSSFETVWQWTNEQVKEYLAGTTTQAGSTVDWNRNENLLQERFENQIRPYLEHCQLITKTLELDRFSLACQCLSTRCFHLTANEQESYTGPFLLPVIDLLNHSTSDKCTTLRRKTDSFIMVAERNIAADNEVLHSYGDSLTASQFLQTFGFVPFETIHACCQPTMDTSTRSITPAILSKQTVLDACWIVIESDMPQQLAASIQEHDMEDEVWKVSVDRERSFDSIPDDLLIDAHKTLSDELITLACLPFLPTCAYAEAKESLLDRSILEDYYLGKLVCTSLLKCLQIKQQSYKRIRQNGMDREDHELLSELASNKTHDVGTRRMMYGLAVRIEEKTRLDALRKEVIQILASLDEDAVDDGMEVKRQRVNS